MPAIKTGKPIVKLLAWLEKPFDLAVASARSCYNPALVYADEITDKQRDAIGKSIFEAGHHTPFQHPTFVFGLENISRQFAWSFLHSHPFYNSEQSSQRYNVLGEARVFVPPIQGDELKIYNEAVEHAWNAYNELSKILFDDTRRAMEGIARIKGLNEKQAAAEAEKKAVETARYVVPVAAFTSMYHTVSGIVLHRYLRMANAGDCPTETSHVVRAMVEEVNKVDPSFFGKIGQEPIPLQELPEHKNGVQPSPNFNAEFDAQLGGLASKLVGFDSNAEKLVADAVREVHGATPSTLSDDAALELVLNPAKNPLLLETLNAWTHSPVMRALNHSTYVFKKKISHTADSQNQRHRTTPASRPLLTKTHSLQPDFITPQPIAANKEAKAVYDKAMNDLWQAKNELVARGVSPEFACYLLPNAAAIRFTESVPLIHFLHKARMRTCFNAQREIFDVTMQELAQIAAVHPRLVKHAGPACYARRGLVEEKQLEGPCPEGVRWCGITVWKNFPHVKRPF